jgi:iron(III) transport system substrate-binding protein
MGTLVIPNAALRIAGGPNTEPAEQFINFLLTPEIEQALAESEAAQMPVRPGVPIPDGVRSLESITPMRVDYMELAPILERISRSYLKEWVDRNLQ